MRKGKRLVTALLCVALLCTPLTPYLSGLFSASALAAEALFPAVNTYAGFTDVPQGAWYYAAVKLCNEVGLMDGTGGNAFSPSGTLTVGEVATLTARLLEGLGGDTIVRATALPGETRAWYADYVDYLSRVMAARSGDWSYQKDLLTRPTDPVSRYGFLSLLDLASGQQADLLPAINAIQTLPDTEDATVLRFYNAGILTGTDDYGTFDADRTLSRAEAAAMLARIADPNQRERFTPKAKEQKPALSYEEEFLQTEALRVNGISINFATYEEALCSLALQHDQYDLDYGTAFSGVDWDYAEEGSMSLSDAFKILTTELCVRSVVLQTKANALGVSVDQLAAALTPNPSQEALAAFARENDLLAAKHILIKTVDDNRNPLGNEAIAKSTAENIIASLNANSNAQQFENLLQRYNEDPGMKQSPEGYLFTAGEMVSEFENAVRALQPGQFTTIPVKSAYGYHVIMRLDPTTLSETKAYYQDYALEQYTKDWVNSATVTLNEAEINRLNAKAVYVAYLQALLSGR